MTLPTLILVPGLLCDEVCFAPQAPLGALARLQVADHGMRDSLGDMAEAILAEAPGRFALAGHSMGGRVALEVQRRAPGRVTHLALLDTGYEPLAAGEPGERERSGRMRLLEIARTLGMRTMAEEWARPMVHPSRLADRELWEAIISMFERSTPERFAAQIHALLHRPDASALLPTIACPTLVLCGREDAWSPPERHEALAALVPRSRLVIVPECGHMSTMEQPQAVNDALRALLQADGR